MRDPAYRVLRKLYGYKPARRFLPASIRDRLRRERSVRDHLRRERMLISDSLEACRRYLLLPRLAWHRHIYAEIISREDVWSGETNLEGLNSLPLFDAAAAAGDKAGAKKVAQSILGRLGDSLYRQTCRTIMAARALLVHDDLDICDQLLFDLSEDEDPARAQIERVLLTLFHDEAVDLNRELIGRLIASEKAPLLVLREWVRRCWLYEGATAAVLDEMLFCAERYKEPEDRLLLLREPLALAFLLDDLSLVKRLLSTYPDLDRSYLYVLPLATHLSSTVLSSRVAEKRGEIVELARLHGELDEYSRSLTGLLRDQTQSIAIVGNSACELGSGKGSLIDAHDMVARFNRFSVEEEFARDYGRKCTIHVMHNMQDIEVNEDSVASEWTVIDRPDLIYRGRKWTDVLALSSSGVKICLLPVGFHQHLYRRLRGDPSAGIIFCSLVKAVRGFLPRESCFGFSFVDQIGKAASSAHYFEHARPSFRHRWTLEKQMFEELTGDDSPKDASRMVRSGAGLLAN